LQQITDIVAATRFKNFFHLQKCDSTNLYAEKLVKEGFDSGVILSDMQCAGKGRGKKFWFSPNNDNIYITFFSKLNSSDSAKNIPFASALSLSMTANEFLDREFVHIKWPNDMLIQMKKSAGFLGKTISFNNDSYFIIGIGLNVNTPDATKFSYVWEPGSLNMCSKAKLSGKTVVESLIKNVEKALSTGEEVLIKEYQELLLWMKNKKAVITTDYKQYTEGVITGFSKNFNSICFLTTFGKELNLSSCSIEKIYET